MAILLGHTTALEYWRSLASMDDPLLHRALIGSPAERRNATAHLQQHLTTAQGRKESAAYLSEDPSAHIITVDKQLSTQCTLATAHVVKSLPSYSCIRANRHFQKSKLYVSTPEFCFLQMATQLTLAELIALGFELCGTYAQQDDRTVFGGLPLSTPERIAAFLLHAENHRGIKMARRALKHVIAGSASPMETALTMFLTLPYSLGGYGIASPQLNYRIDIPASMARTVDSHYYVCDLYWKEAALAIEYDSNLAHSGINKTVRDAMRRSVLTALGISVLSVTWPQVKNKDALKQLAHLVAKKTHKRLQYSDPEFTLRHLALRSTLLRPSQNDDIEALPPRRP